jgi:PTH1 family peptidyl-tRNA hydrolase
MLGLGKRKGGSAGPPLLLVGLGNPGAKYAGNRHNVGFMAAQAIAEEHGFGAAKSKFQGALHEGRLGGERALILKPQTYMNESGQSVGAAMRFYKVPLDRLVVCYDELDLAPGKVRMKTGGGTAGHNGIRSITRHVGAEFRRMRIGIGHPGQKDKVTPYVLGDFAKSDQVWLRDLLEAIARAAPYLAEGCDERFQSEVARLAPPPDLPARAGS